jgi:MraZ protein
MFQGRSQLTLDGKGRVSIPTRYRDVLTAQHDGLLTLTRHPDGCLVVYPRSVWLARREQVEALPYSARALRRLVLGSAADTEIDNAGRVQVPAELRSAAGLDRDVMLVGNGAHLELWDVTRLAEHEKSQLAEAESVGSFSF